MSPKDLLLAPSCDAGWLLVEEGVVLAREHEIESIFALANGYVGTRASLAEGGALSRPATFAAGVYTGTGRGDHADALRTHGADLVVGDLGELSLEGHARGRDAA